MKCHVTAAKLTTLNGIPLAPLPDLPDERVKGVDDALPRLGRRHEERAAVELGQALRLFVVHLGKIQRMFVTCTIGTGYKDVIFSSQKK